jgi:DNA (cytosine-5)-methyltransferase 1
MAAIDLYSGIGGWTLGFKMAGIEVVASYEWWKDANLTHNKNFGSHHDEIDIRSLDLSTLPDKRNIQYVVGSPPCTQFSYSNRGGNGDIKDGLVDIKKFLEVVDHLQPKYWAMENVPRVAKILEKEIKPKGKLAKFKHLFGEIRVYNSSDFGVPQDRKRMIAGRLPFQLLDAYKDTLEKRDLSEVLNSLRQAPYTDPIYGIRISKNELTDHVLEPNLSEEEARMNEEAKTHHPVYNKMSFPDRQNRPSRTITALCTRVSRESIVIRDHLGNLRRLTVRERACVQSFPMNYQFFGSTYPNKLKMIGNAVPPLLTFYIAQSMLETPVDSLLLPRNVPRERLRLSPENAKDHTPENEGAKYPWNRSFWLAIKGLRFGSGVRFDLKNFNDKETKTTTWRINFYYGNSKSILNKELDRHLFDKAIRATSVDENEEFNELFNDFLGFVRKIDERKLQKNWTNVDRTVTGPIKLIDVLSGYSLQFKEKLKELDMAYSDAITYFIKTEFEKKTQENEDKKKKETSEIPKSADRGMDIFVGILIGAAFNLILQGETVKIRKIKVRA